VAFNWGTDLSEGKKPDVAIKENALLMSGGVQVGSSTLAIPFGGGVQAPADWYFPTQVDGETSAQGVIWLQHASGTTGRVCYWVT
jgi:hypothetical protein